MSGAENPILSQWHQFPVSSDEKIGEGFVSGQLGKQMGVRRKVFETPTGAESYVYKEVASESEARSSIGIYTSMKEAGLPVVSFAKILRKKVDGIFEYAIAMEDLTEGGVLIVHEFHGTKEGPSPIEEIISHSEVAHHLMEEVIYLLAVLHNNEIIDYHPGISFAIRTDRDGVIVDVKIIDYANFESLKDMRPLRGMTKEETFDSECESDLRSVLYNLTSNPALQEELVNLYWNIREEKQKYFVSF